MIATLIKRTNLTGDIYSFDFSIPKSLKHIPGQYVNLTIKHDNPDDRHQERWFSVSSQPLDDQFQITTRFFGDKSSSFKRALMKLIPGDTIDVSDPMGDFIMPMDQSRDLLFVAAGIGITPFLSMLKYLVSHAEKRNVYLFYAARSRDQLVNIDNLKSVIKEIDYFIDQDNKRLSSKIILEKAKTLSNPLVYLAGPEKMTESFRDELVSLGFNREDIVGDYFDGY